jgi:cytochrome c heme-lyase
MGGGQSKETVAPATTTTTTTLNVPETTTTKPAVDELPKQEEQQEESKCPMHRGDGSYSYDWRQFFGAVSEHGKSGSKPLSKEEQDAAKKNGPLQAASSSSSSGGGCPVKHNAAPKTAASTTDGCPVMHESKTQHPEYNVYSQPIDKTNQMPKGIKTQLPVATQRSELSTDRVNSSIPKGGGDDTSSSTTTWTYPSPQQFYNALARKDKLDDDTSEDDMESVVALHNNMNEKTWGRVVEWERQTYDANSTPKLLKFQGRPSDLSPKAMLKHYLLGHPLPYDRHDWTVLRGDGATVRYVIDYYFDESQARESPESAKPSKDQPDATPSLLVDVRPALDGPTELLARALLMPYKSATNATTFDYLPLRASTELAGQVRESVQVWQSIQQAVQNNDNGATTTTTTTTSDSILERDMAAMTIISESQAKEIAQNFANVLGACQKQQQAMGVCTSEEEYSKASMDLTMCMGPILCQVQHASIIKTLQEDDDDKIEAALETLSDCVVYQNAQRQLAKQQHPKIFA